MDPYRNDEVETVELERPDSSTRLFALRLGADVIARPNSELVLVRHRRDLSANAFLDAIPCVQFLRRCREPFNKQADAMLDALIGRYLGDKIPLAFALLAQAAVNTWLIDTIRRECKCTKANAAPEKNVEALQSHADFNGYAACIAAAAAVLVPTLVVPLGLVGAMFWMLNIYNNRLARDPPNANFTTPPSLQTFELPEIDLSGIAPDVATSTMRMVQRMGESIAASQALLTAMEKYQGAALAGDVAAQSLQLGAAAEFAERLADSLEAHVSVRTEFVAALRSAGMVRLITVDDVVDIVVAGIPPEPPTAFRQAIEHYGEGLGVDVLESWQRTFAQPMEAVGVFPESLNAPKMADAEVALAASLRKSAVKWRG